MPASSTSGGGAGDIRAGGAFWEVYMRDGMTPSLDRVGEKLKKFDAMVKKVGSFSFAGAFLGGLAGGASVTGVLTSVGQMAADWVMQTKELERAMQGVVRELERAGGSMSTILKGSAEWRATMLDRGDKINSAQGDFDFANKDLGELLKKRRAADVLGASRGWSESLRNHAEALDKAISESIPKVRELAAELSRLKNPEDDKKVVGAITEATVALRSQVETWGQVGAAADRALFKVGNVSDGMLKEFDEAAAKLKSLEETNSLFPQLKLALTAAGQIGEKLNWGDRISGLGNMLSMPMFAAGMAGDIGGKLQDAMNSASVRGSSVGSRLSGQFAFGDKAGGDTQNKILSELRDHLARKVGESVAEQLRAK